MGGDPIFLVPQATNKMPLYQNPDKNARLDVIKRRDEKLKDAMDQMEDQRRQYHYAARQLISYEKDLKEKTAAYSDSPDYKEWAKTMEQRIEYWRGRISMEWNILIAKEQDAILARQEKQIFDNYCAFHDFAYMARVSQEEVDVISIAAPDDMGNGKTREACADYWSEQAKKMRVAYWHLKPTDY